MCFAFWFTGTREKPGGKEKQGFCHLQVTLSYNGFRNDLYICDTNQRKSRIDVKKLWLGVLMHVYVYICVYVLDFMCLCVPARRSCDTASLNSHLLG